MTLPSSGLLRLQLGLGLAGEQHPHRAVEERDRRHRQQCSDDAGEDTARGDGQHHRQRMDRHRAAHHQRLQHVALELLHGDDERRA